MIWPTFTHRQLLDPEKLLSALGVPISDPKFPWLLEQVTIIMHNVLMIAAIELNSKLQDNFQVAISSIYEYNLLPGQYEKVMRLCLSNPSNINVYRSSTGVWQAQFINFNLVGDVTNLQQIHIAVRGMFYHGDSAGSLEGWKKFVGGWLRTRDSSKYPYPDVIEARLDMMRGENGAPFLDLVENGNMGYAAWPQNDRKDVLLSFVSVYERKMREVYIECLSSTRALINRELISGIGAYKEATVVIEDKLVSGREWMSKQTNRIFVEPGTFFVDINGRPQGKGFILDKFGNVVKRFSGWLPK